MPATVHTTAGTPATVRALSRAHSAVAEQRLRICIGTLTDSDVLTPPGYIPKIVLADE
ncbi:hypothetical protein ACFWP3_14050 [Streptomyces sp. NPDC058525]|uniref:hypothetical protein n=1 Tax=Streptomyces sp. NPDC058525 TaxID=3346538 RepID=UPI0036683C23